MALRMIADGVSARAYDRMGPLGLLGLGLAILGAMLALLAGLTAWRQGDQGRNWLLVADAALAFLAGLTILQVGLAELSWLIAVVVVAGLALEAAVLVPPPAEPGADETEAELEADEETGTEAATAIDA